MKLAVVYARYSSEKQNDQSIEGQLDVCQKYAAQNGLEIVDTYIDALCREPTTSAPHSSRCCRTAQNPFRGISSSCMPSTDSGATQLKSLSTSRKSRKTIKRSSPRPNALRKTSTARKTWTESCWKICTSDLQSIILQNFPKRYDEDFTKTEKKVCFAAGLLFLATASSIRELRLTKMKRLSCDISLTNMHTDDRQRTY